MFAADGRLQLWNNRFRALWGLEEAFLSGHPRVDVFAQAAAGQLATPNRSALIPELVRSATMERQQRGGRVAFADGRHFEFAAVPLPDGNALFTMLDITDSRRAEQALRDRNQALEEADKVKTQFVANMSYELRTPLTSIGGFAEMLRRRLCRRAVAGGEGLCLRDPGIGRAAGPAGRRRARPDAGRWRGTAAGARRCRSRGGGAGGGGAGARRGGAAAGRLRGRGAALGGARDGRRKAAARGGRASAAPRDRGGAGGRARAAPRRRQRDWRRGWWCRTTGRAWTPRRRRTPSTASRCRASSRAASGRWAWGCRSRSSSSRRMAARSTLLSEPGEGTLVTVELPRR